MTASLAMNRCRNKHTGRFASCKARPKSQYNPCSACVARSERRGDIWALCLLVFLLGFIASILLGCGGSKYATGVHTGRTAHTIVSPPKIKPLELSPAARLSRPVEVREYKEPVRAPAFEVREIELGPEYATFYGLRGEIETLMPQGNETKRIRVLPDGIEEVVTGSSMQEGGPIASLTHLVKWILALCLVLAACAGAIWAIKATMFKRLLQGGLHAMLTAWGKYRQ